ncbi:hypothetical protein [Butyrivibrio sp.]|uniref:hypothetical protein n=1 Tax=Butyrivibrio sp. TaxID=28121 RepID=UPI0025B94174|nr:hypothetical protein [Butyrivibrio sp.]MBE5838436.1 hypothetical protein [Butyrivibrio sp.]
MDTSKILYFLKILATETTGHIDEIEDLYLRALNENDDIQGLDALLEDLVFDHETGKSLLKEARSLLEKIYTYPIDSVEMLPDIKREKTKIDSMYRACMETICSPAPTTETISVLRKRDIIAYIEAFRMIANASIHLMLVYGGADTVKNLTWNDSVGVQESFYAVNTRFLPSLCSIKKPDYGWIITKKRLGRNAVFCDEFFLLNYERMDIINEQCKHLLREPIGTHAFLNVEAYESGRCEVPYCWGIGNIVSTSPGTALSFLQEDYVERLRFPQPEEYTRKLPSPFECVKQLADGRSFCITADELLRGMNSWYVGCEIERRKSSHICLLCGKYIDSGKYVCRSHFTSEFK